MDEKLKKLLAEILNKHRENAGFMYRAKFIAETKAIGDNQIEAIIATNTIDRHGEILEIDGVDLKQFKKNPVVLWAHDYSGLPIAKAISISKNKDGQIVSKMEFNPDDEFSMKVYNAVKNGFLSAFSIGFIPTDGTYDEKINGYRWTKSEMLEYSVVPVPANAEALVQAKAFMELGILKAENIKKADESHEDEDIDKDEDIDPDEPETKTAKTKAGKVLSAKNRDALVAAREAIDAVLKADDGTSEEKGSDDLSNILKKASSATGDLLAQATEQGNGRSPKKQKILLVKAKKTVQIIDKTAELLIADLNKQIRS